LTAKSAKADTLIKQTAIEMQSYFDSDIKRIAHAMNVAVYAEKIGKKEDCDMLVLMLAAFLHDIGIHEAERQYQSTAPKYQEQEGPPIADRILSALGADDSVKQEVCDIIGHHHHPRPKATRNFKVLYDADRIANLAEKQKIRHIEVSKLQRVIEKSFLTKTGKEVAKKLLCQGRN
jgi:HD superfamily phosphodiesterase